MNEFGDNMSAVQHKELACLLDDIKNGSDAAFARLLERYDGLVRHRVAVFGHHAQDADDAYQEACLALHRAALRYRMQNDVTFGLYAKVCIDNALKTKYKRDAHAAGAAAGQRVDLVPFEEGRFFAYFSDPVIEEEKVEELLSLIRSELSAYERQVFDLYIQKLSSAEIADRLGRDEKSIKNAIGRLLGKLRKRLGR
ncbi:MAG: sigma-70 family RNA polymerase sigma factor [Clostridia bacterium]|nr:sigma-70 family RNA polymerase sigma factor [Clostridia bacterium]